MKARIKKIDKALSEQDKALSLLGTRHNGDGSVHMYEGNAVKLPLEVIKCLGEHIVTQPESPTTHVSERDIIKNAQWIRILFSQYRQPYKINGVGISNKKGKDVEISFANPGKQSELGLILGNHAYYKDIGVMDSARARKSKYWNVELQLPDGPYYQKNDKPVYGPSLYYFDEKGWEQRTKIQKKPL